MSNGSCEDQSIDIAVTPTGSGQHSSSQVVLRCGGNVLHVDTFKIDNSRSRTAFLNAAAKQAEAQGVDFDRDRGNQLLMQHAADRPAAATTDAGGQPSVDYTRVLGCFGLEVLGEQDDQSIVCWVGRTGKRWRVKTPAGWKVEEMLQALGQLGADHLWRDTGPPPPDRFRPNVLREALALAAAAAPRLSANLLVGQGIWKQ